ncbi:MAG: hypothetical protein ACRDRN_12050 [Sciscionella sp.]
MRIPVPGPSDVFRLAETVRGAVNDAVALVPRLIDIVGEVEGIVARVGPLITAIGEVERRAGGAVGEVEGIVARLDPLLRRLEPTLDKLEPIVTRLAETTDPDEVQALVKLVNHLPELVEKVDTAVLPMLDTLGTVAPDLRELLITSQELNEIVASIPGMGRMRDRVLRQMKHENSG